MQVFHSMTATPRVKCEACGSRSVKRILGTGAGIIFKGSGFYETDYKRNGKGSAGTSEGAAKSDAKSEPKSESKSSKSEAKSESKSKAGSGTSKPTEAA